MHYVIASAIVLLLSSTPILRADETVSVGGSNAILLRPSAPRASIILMPGGDGYIAAGPGGTIGKLKGNQLVRTRNASFSATCGMQRERQTPEPPNAVHVSGGTAAPVSRKLSGMQ